MKANRSPHEQLAANCLIALLLALVCSTSAYGMEEVYAFQVSGQYPKAKLVQGSDGNFYGTTSNGGSNSFGMVFKMTPTGSMTSLVAFGGTDGAGPLTGLVLGSNGVFYGTTDYGGIGAINNNLGTIFKITTNGVLTPLVSFGNTNGANPRGDLIQATDGNFYGTTFNGGANSQGTVFRMTPTGVLTTLASFVVVYGSNPSAGLVQASDGNFYGTTSAGGANGTGTIFRMTPGGTLTAIYTFSPVNAYGQNADGAYPKAALIQASDGYLYGTTYQGGSNALSYSSYGTIFKVTTNGALTTLVTLGNTMAPGSLPNASLVQGIDGNFYGTTSSGMVVGTSNYIGGMLFKMTPSGLLTPLGGWSGASGADGLSPVAGLIQGNDGDFYGTTSSGGIADYGTVFKMTSAGSLTVLNAFVNANGRYPRGLARGLDGNFYGVAYNDGPKGAGTVFRISSAGAFTNLVSFNWTDQYKTGTGAWPQAALVRGRDGNFYGTTFYGGVNNRGSVFKVTPTGVLTTWGQLPTQNSDLQSEPSLVEGSDGNFYGVSRNTVFRVTTNGVITQIATLPSVSSAGLVEGVDGNFYGTAAGGQYNRGMIFRVTPVGVVTTWASFTSADGENPQAALVRGNDGNFYGTTADGGVNNNGTVFRMTPEGVLTTLVSFNGANGMSPRAALIQAIDGNFYGTTTAYANGLEFGKGTIFRMTPAGVLTTIEIFNKGRLDINAPNTGLAGRSPLVQGTDGNIYGTTYGGGSYGGGNIFRVFSALNVQRFGNQFVVSWSTNSPDYTLQWATNLTPPVVWINSTSVPVVIGTQFVVTNSTPDPAGFNRLFK